MAVISAIIIVCFGLTILSFYQKYTNGKCKSHKRLDGKTTLITGGTTGMGLKIATDFAKRGARVIIACPFQKEGTSAEQTIVRNTGNDKVVFKLLDLVSLDSVRKFAADILKTEDRLDILVNNAAVGVPNDFITPDGMSFIMQVNYFGHFLLTLLLLPLLKKTGKSSEATRVVNTSSFTHILGGFAMNNLNRINFINFLTYSKSKYCLALFTLELSKKLDKNNIVVNSIDPGAVGTKLQYSAGIILGTILVVLFNLCFKTTRQGAQTALHVALDEGAGKVSGEFFRNCKLSSAVPWAYNDKLLKKVWDDSVKLVKLDDRELEHIFKSL